MRTIRSMTGMPVVCRSKRIGRLVQTDLSTDLKQLEGIWVDRGLRGTRYIASDQLEMIGRVAVMTDNPGKKKRFTASTLLMRAVGTDGGRIGAIVGAEIDELSFIVNSLELTCGFWDDLYNRRVRIEHFSVCPERNEVIIMDSTNDPEKEVL